jgi:hypothetical protein
MVTTSEAATTLQSSTTRRMFSLSAELTDTGVVEQMSELRPRRMASPSSFTDGNPALENKVVLRDLRRASTQHSYTQHNDKSPL